MTSGTNLHSRYHPGYSPEENLSSGSNKPYLCNGRARISLLAIAFTRSTQESDRQTPPHRLTPSAGSLKLQNKANFPSKSFYMIEHIKTQQTRFVNSHHSKNALLYIFTKSPLFLVKIFDKKTFAFSSKTY